ncbi:hypothetical protein D9M68_96510 [compost metagenome]
MQRRCIDVLAPFWSGAHRCTSRTMALGEALESGLCERFQTESRPASTAIPRAVPVLPTLTAAQLVRGESARFPPETLAIGRLTPCDASRAEARQRHCASVSAKCTACRALRLILLAQGWPHARAASHASASFKELSTIRRGNGSTGTLSPARQGARPGGAISPGNKGTFGNGAVIATACQLRPGGARPAARLSCLIRMGNHYSHRETP